MELGRTIVSMEIGLTVVILIVVAAMLVAHFAGRSGQRGRSRLR